MDFFSPKKGKPKPKAKVAPIPNAGAAAPSAHAVAAQRRIIPRQERYNIGFAANRPMSNANKAALAARRRIMIRTARNYGPASAGGAGGAGGAGAAAAPRPTLVIPNNNNVYGGPAGGAGAGAAGLGEYGMLPYVNMDASLAAGHAAAPAAPAAPAAGNEFVNVNLSGGSRRRKTRRRHRTHRRRA